MKFENDIPIYIQIIELLKMQIISGYYKPGDKIPSVREFSSLYKVNPNTILKALESLESNRLLYTMRTNGKFVTEDMKLISKLKNDMAKSYASEYMEKMNKLGISCNDAILFLKKGDVGDEFIKN